MYNLHRYIIGDGQLSIIIRSVDQVFVRFLRRAWEDCKRPPESLEAVVKLVARLGIIISANEGSKHVRSVYGHQEKITSPLSLFSHHVVPHADVGGWLKRTKEICDSSIHVKATETLLKMLFQLLIATESTSFMENSIPNVLSRNAGLTLHPVRFCKESKAQFRRLTFDQVGSFLPRGVATIYARTNARTSKI